MKINEFTSFGTAGNPDSFYADGYKSSLDMPQWLAGKGLTAYEYQCGRGVHIGEKTARALGLKAMEHGVKLSIHAPYYINLATEDEKIAESSKHHLIKSVQAAKWMGADRVVFHIGSQGKQERLSAIKRAQNLFYNVLDEVDRRGLTGVYLAPETMGKQSQLGSLEEVLSFCQMSDRVIPTVDFGHLHAVSLGRVVTLEEFEYIFDRIGNVLGGHVVENLHVHFSKIEFTKSGEKKHWTFDDNYGPPHEPFLEVIVQKGIKARVICESAGTQAEDAMTMRDKYFELLGKN